MLINASDGSKLIIYVEDNGFHCKNYQKFNKRRSLLHNGTPIATLVNGSTLFLFKDQRSNKREKALHQSRNNPDKGSDNGHRQPGVNI